jgi:hypothetical protein
MHCKSRKSIRKLKGGALARVLALRLSGMSSKVLVLPLKTCQALTSSRILKRYK